MATTRQALRIALDDLENELKALDFRQPLPPSAADLASSAPFCHDTLGFPEWLQWVFLPRMRALLDGDHALPETCDIAPYAREMLQGRSGTTKLIVLIRRCDELISESDH